MDIKALAAEIGTAGKAVAAYAGMSAAQVAEALNTPRKVGTRLRELTTREVLDALGHAGGAKEAAKVEGTTDEAVALAAYLYGAGGVDMAEGSFGRSLLAVVVSAEGLAACVAAATEDVVVSRREEIGLTEPVGDGHVRSIAGWEAK
jgi:hypothetical protein